MNDFYDIQKIKLTDEYLTDPMMLALAWKRAHHYIRTQNWYADNFELDQSSLFLQKKCDEWKTELESKQIKLSPLELVPAPKASEWEFTEASNLGKKYLRWQPKKDSSELSLRPLAHIGIKEQTYFTLLMTCLANTVESKQGDPTTDYEQVHEKGVVNYGNRLYCTYDDEGNAEHNYGGTTIYGKYFVDYRKFLQRPYHFAKKASSEKLPSEEVYIVELDLSKFYDSVDKPQLVKKIEKLIENQNDGKKDKDYSKSIVKKLLKQFECWDWSEKAKAKYSVCPKVDEEQSPRLGIPQGLVAGGFLANIYLSDIDADMLSIFRDKPNKNKDLEELIKSLESSGIKIHDYCRYVDDIRLVAVAPKKFKLNASEMLEMEIDQLLTGSFEIKAVEHLKKKITQLIGSFISSYHLGLEINEDKTKVVPFKGKPTGISTQLDEFQSRFSGPQSPEQVDNIISELESLLTLTGTSPKQNDDEYDPINTLAEIERSSFDVREDTLRRFVANKLVAALKEKRHFTSREVDDAGQPIAGEWDYLQERVARRLIAVWSKDPSLVMLLKKGLELFPSPKVLEPVLDQINEICDRGDEKLTAIMHYCLAEVFRHSATVIHKKDPHTIPAHADVTAYFELLQDKASSLLFDEGAK